MSTRPVTRFIAAAMIAVAGVAMLAASFDAEARRMGGGMSFGRQSTNVMRSRPATVAPSTPAAVPRATPSAAAPAAGAAAAAGARSGASRWLGPLAGIAAGLGIGALLSHMGFSGAFGEFLSNALLIALVIFAVMFVVRRLRGVGPRPAAQASLGHGGNAPAQPMWRESLNADAQMVPAGNAAPAVAAFPALGTDESAWSVPSDFDTPRFLAQAKQQFVAIQALWDSGQTDRLREFLTDDLIAELKPQLVQRGESSNTTEVVLLNAELLGVESVSGGNLASVRFSGMLREAVGAEAFRFEEVWNLFKPEQGGWMLAGIQQIPVEYAS